MCSHDLEKGDGADEVVVVVKQGLVHALANSFEPSKVNYSLKSAAAMHNWRNYQSVKYFNDQQQLPRRCRSRKWTSETAELKLSCGLLCVNQDLYSYTVCSTSTRNSFALEQARNQHSSQLNRIQSSFDNLPYGCGGASKAADSAGRKVQRQLIWLAD